MATDYNDKKYPHTVVSDAAVRLMQPDGSMLTVNWLTEILAAIAAGAGGGGANDYELSEIIFKDTNLNSYVVRKVEQNDGVETVAYYDLLNVLLDPQPDPLDLEPVAIDHNAETLSQIYTLLESHSNDGNPLQRNIVRVAAATNITVSEAVNWRAILADTVTDFTIDGVSMALGGVLMAEYGEEALPNFVKHPDVTLRATGGEFILISEVST